VGLLIGIVFFVTTTMLPNLGTVIGIFPFFNVLLPNILFVIVNSKIQEMDNKKSTFKCQYISGKCKVKVTEKNCSGGLPVSYCEGKLNGRW